MKTTESPPDPFPSQLAIDYITTNCKYIGAFHGSMEAHRFLNHTANKMSESQPTSVMPERYIEHVAYALSMVANNLFTSSPAAIAAIFLVTRFEFYFRILSGKLNPDGTWVSEIDRQEVSSSLKDRRILKSRRVSSVSLAYKIMKLNQTSDIVRHFSTIDDILYPTPKSISGLKDIADLGDRIEFGRHSIGHGHWADISAEAIFYGLMTSIVFHNLS